MTKDMTTASLEMFTELLNATESIRNLTKGKDGKISVVGRVQWTVFKKPKITYLRAAIEAYKSNLTLMLGLLNTAEKVTRRVSLEITPDIAAEEEQDRLLLQSLELDQKSSLNELEQAERAYHDADLASNDESAETPSADSVPDNILEDLRIASRPMSEPDSLVSSIHEEIESIRSSLSISPSPVFDPSVVQDQVVRYSQRLSILVSADQNRISHQGLNTPNSFSSNNRGTIDGMLPLNSPNPSYVAMRKWLLSQDVFHRKVILEELGLEVYYHAIKLPYTDDIKEKNLRQSITEQVKTYESAQRGIRINLNDKALRNIPDAIIDVLPNNLESLTLAHNYLRRLPPSLALCQRLTYLNLCDNKLEKVPEVMFNIPSLEFLYLAGNRLSVIPAMITNLEKLRVLDVRENNITGLPFVLADLPELTRLKYDGNPIGFPTVKLMHAKTERGLKQNSLEYSRIHTKLLKKYLASYPEDVSETVARLIIGILMHEKLPAGFDEPGGCTKKMLSQAWRVLADPWRPEPISTATSTKAPSSDSTDSITTRLRNLAAAVAGSAQDPYESPWTDMDELLYGSADF